MLRIREYIGENLRNSDLNPDAIARAVYISTRHLHEVFHEQGTTVSAWIREQRIEAIRRDLADPMHAHRAIADVAASWGYPDAPTSRARSASRSACRPAHFAGPRSERDPATGVAISQCGAIG